MFVLRTRYRSEPDVPFVRRDLRVVHAGWQMKQKQNKKKRTCGIRHSSAKNNGVKKQKNKNIGSSTCVQVNAHGTSLRISCSVPETNIIIVTRLTLSSRRVARSTFAVWTIIIFLFKSFVAVDFNDDLCLPEHDHLSPCKNYGLIVRSKRPCDGPNGIYDSYRRAFIRVGPFRLHVVY